MTDVNQTKINTFLNKIRGLISTHNNDATAHPSISSRITTLENEIMNLEEDMNS